MNDGIATRMVYGLSFWVIIGIFRSISVTGTQRSVPMEVDIPCIIDGIKFNYSNLIMLRLFIVLFSVLMAGDAWMQKILNEK
jgi:hypothetical protein